LNNSTEHQEQCAFVQWLQWTHPDVVVHSIPNGAYTTNAYHKQKLKNEGLLKGCPDLFIAEPAGQYHGLYIEMKKQSKGYVTHNQKYVMKLLENRGYKCVIAKGCQQAIDSFEGYLNVK
jgi:hypothetical protein